MKMARSKALGGSQPASRDYTYLAEISYGQSGKCSLSSLTRGIFLVRAGAWDGVGSGIRDMVGEIHTMISGFFPASHGFTMIWHPKLTQFFGGREVWLWEKYITNP